jgi:hypothetical protein
MSVTTVHDTMTASQAADPRQLMSFEQAAIDGRCTVRTIFRRVEHGKLRTVKRGKRTYIERGEFERFFRAEARV